MLVLALTELGSPEIVEAQRAFHLAAGVDLVLVPDDLHDPSAGWDGVAAERGAAWLIEAGAGEFWWPRGGSLADLVGAIPDDVDAVEALERGVAPNGSPVEMPLPTWRGPRLLRRPGTERSALRGWFPIDIRRFEDTRVQEALPLVSAGGTPSFSRPTAVDDPSFATDVATWFEDELRVTTTMLATLEPLAARLAAGGLRGAAARVAHRARRRGLG